MVTTFERKDKGKGVTLSWICSSTFICGTCEVHPCLINYSTTMKYIFHSPNRWHDIDHRKTKFFFFVPYYHTTSTLFTIYALLPRLPTVSLYSRTTVGIHKQLPCVCLFCKPTWVVPCQSEIWHSLLPLLSPAEKETERLKNLLQDIFEFISIFFLVCWIFFGQHLGHLRHSPAFQSWGKSSWVKFIFNHIFYLSHR